MDKLVLMQQIHGSNIEIVGSGDAGKTIAGCDGLITASDQVMLGVRVADCLPVKIYCPKHNIVGVFHAGWRGLELQILPKAVEKFIKEFHCDPAELQTEIGPHICAAHYEIRDDVAVKFENHKNALKNNKGRKFLDLAQAAKEQLISASLIEENIKISSDCTYEDPGLPSFRRNGTTQRLNCIVRLNTAGFDYKVLK